MSTKRMKWDCPYCDRPSTIKVYPVAQELNAVYPTLDSDEGYLTEPEVREEDMKRWHDAYEGIYKLAGDEGIYKLEVFSAVCLNDECKRLYLRVSVNLPNDIYHPSGKERFRREQLEPWTSGTKWQLLPESNAKPFPNYILESILKDYREACCVKNLSPNAAATLARRCLQGMVRDRWGINGCNNLKDELDKIKDDVTPEEWQAIDEVRQLGNIGAHMEKDMNVMVDVEEGEADLLIKLIEFLLKEWYVNRHDRKQWLKQIPGLAGKKKQKASNKKKDIPQVEGGGDG